MTRPFAAAVKQASGLAEQGNLVTFGIVPDAPETGFGYIETDLNSPLPSVGEGQGERVGGYAVKRFVITAYDEENKQAAEDITQETFIKVWKKIKKYNPDKNFKTWLFTIARNTAIDWLRKKRNLVFSNFENNEGENYLENELVDPNPLPDKILTQTEDQEFVEKLLQQLAPIYREVLILRYNNDLTFEEIAEILDKPLDTVKSQHRRALIILRKLIEQK